MAKRKLGEFIEQTDIRNSNNKFGENELRGLSVYKSFIKTHANLNGVTFGNYKVIYPNDFVYIPDTSRRGDKIAIAKNDNDNCLIVSNVYTSFKVINENELNPDYLMLIFKNSEFDRYARYNSWGSAREVFSWEDFCNTEIEVPSIQEQEKIVQRYKVVTDRIEILNKINKNLQDTAQVLYKHWFVDFEFLNEEGKPYKSSGGKMVYSKELDKDIPEGWEVKNIKDIALIIWGVCPDGNNILPLNTAEVNAIDYCSGGGDMNNGFIVDCQAKTNDNKRLGKDNDILMSIAGTIGKKCIADHDISLGRATMAFRATSSDDIMYIYQTLEALMNTIDESVNPGSVQKVLNSNSLKSINFAYCEKYKGMFNKKYNSLFFIIKQNSKQILKLQKLLNFVTPSFVLEDDNAS